MRQNFNDLTIKNLNNYECLIIDNFKNKNEEKLLYSILNQSKQLDNFIVINSILPIKKIQI